MFKWKVKEFQVATDDLNPFDSDEITDWLNEKGFHEQDVKFVCLMDILRIYYKDVERDSE